MNLLSGLITCNEESSGPVALSAQHLHRLFVFTVMWSVGALLELDDRAKMEQFLVEKVCGCVHVLCVSLYVHCMYFWY